MTTDVVIIHAAGRDTKWGNYRGGPKHLVVPSGEREPVLHRAARLFGEGGARVFVSGPYAVPGTTQFDPGGEDASLGEAAKYYAVVPLWNTEGRTIIAYGDTWYDDLFVSRVRLMDDRRWLLFGRGSRSTVTGKPYPEYFAESFWPEHHHERLEFLRKYVARFRTQPAGMHNGVMDIMWKKEHPSDVVEVNGWTEDFDFPKDLDEWERRRALDRAV